VTVGIDQLRTRLTRNAAIDFLFAQLSAFGFNATGWKLDSKQHRFLRAFSTVWSDQSETVRQVSNFTLNDYATGTPLTELARSNFGNDRHPAVKTEGPYKLTNTGATPYTLTPGQLVLESIQGVQFISTTGGSLPATTGQLTVTIQALKAGALGNAPNSSITRFVTPLAGVTGTNEAGVGGAPWYTVSGADEESVPAIRERNRTRITTLNQVAMPADGYKFLAMSVPGIERVKVDDANPRGPNTIDVYIATASGPATSADIADVQALINQKKSPSANVLVLGPALLSLNPAGIVHLSPGFYTAARRAEVLQALIDFVNSLPIGGITLPPATSGVMPKSELDTAMSQIPGVVAVGLTNPAADVPLAALQLLTVGSVTGITFIQA
jgi:phage-related baseplate assembly protein